MTITDQHADGRSTLLSKEQAEHMSKIEREVHRYASA